MCHVFRTVRSFWVSGVAVFFFLKVTKPAFLACFCFVSYPPLVWCLRHFDKKPPLCVFVFFFFFCGGRGGPSGAPPVVFVSGGNVKFSREKLREAGVSPPRGVCFVCVSYAPPWAPPGLRFFFFPNDWGFAYNPPLCVSRVVVNAFDAKWVIVFPKCGMWEWGGSPCFYLPSEGCSGR